MARRQGAEVINFNEVDVPDAVLKLIITPAGLPSSI